MEINKTEAKIIILLVNLPAGDRNPFYISVKLKKHYANIYNNIRLLEAKGIVGIRRVGRKSIVTLNEPEASRLKAIEVLSG